MQVKSLVHRALAGEALERPPVWLMRQAGRYMQEYRDLKEKHGFLGLCKSPELACEVTMQPMRFLNPDAAIVFADILLPAESMGLEVAFAPGPIVKNPIRDRSDIAALRRVDPWQSLSFVFQAISQIRGELIATYGPNKKALFGFAGAPWTMACYLIAQPPFKHFAGTQVFAAKDPEGMHMLLERLTDVTTEYLLGQIESGADVVQLFDSWGGNLSVEDYKKYSLPYLQRIIEGVKKSGCPVVLYASGSAHLLEALAQSGADAISIDSHVSLEAARAVVGPTITLQGNLDPTHLFLAKDEVVTRTRSMIQGVKSHERYIANLGHGILPTTPTENVLAFVKTIQEGWSAQ